ncbi:MAG: hypothetical protein IT308_11870 [Anaerolineaceae bacterium]|nr:hypothetical protein [Anaerolineaceae bacterium]
MKRKFSITPPPWPAWLDRRSLILLIIAAIFLLTLAWSEPLPKPSQPGKRAASLTPSINAQETSDMPEEWKDNAEQTNGILLGGIILVSIIVIGSFSGMRRKPPLPPH